MFIFTVRTYLYTRMCRVHLSEWVRECVCVYVAQLRPDKMTVPFKEFFYLLAHKQRRQKKNQQN